MVYVFLADGFEEVEALTPVDYLRRAGIEVVTVAVGERADVAGAHGITVRADTTLSALDAAAPKGNKSETEKPEALFLPGGMPGTLGLEKSRRLAELLLEYSDDGSVIIAAICAAPSVLGKLGLLRGYRAVCYPGYEAALEGAEVSSERVALDRNRLTGRSAGTAEEFALAFIAALRGGDAAEKLRASLLAR